MNTFTLAVVLLSACSLSASSDPLLIELMNGELRGHDNGLYYSYESIPYAQPPINDLRLEDPLPFTERWTETFDATTPATECLQWSQWIQQPDKLTGSEDCLTVSIFKPKNATRQSFPVVASIFGGAWTFGSSLDDGVEHFMDSGNVIVVKINYRVGPLGFLSTGDNVLPGNYGLKDQRLAIQWIKQNIDRFGGDPENIILLGYGAGGAAVHLQLMHKDMETFVKGAISISGAATSPFALQSSGREDAFRFGKVLGCKKIKSSFALKECFKKTMGHEIVSSVKKLQVFDFIPSAVFRPVIESPDLEYPFLTESPIETIKSGRSAQVPWLASYTTQNGIYNTAMLLQKDMSGKELIYELNTRWNELAPHFLYYPKEMNNSQKNSHSRKLKRQYLGYRNFSVENYFDVQRMFTNELFKNGIEEALDAHRKHGSSPVYAYVYDNPADKSVGHLLAKRMDIFMGTGLGDDYYILMYKPMRGALRADEKLVSWKLVKMVEEFAQSRKLAYDDCVFPDNRGQKQFQLVVIKRTHCEVQEARHLPETVSDHLPPSPVVIF
ncbi:PREDICTED: esterase S-like [Drosophila arizonae]|uniref:carboxylesterase n=1 Tax=Drosophila arizonae TaxID=7263 RepID=A0ABM1NNT2_DROAR|nr:PREDICTED: esterase S-like [Drosophila arizonae]